MIIEQKSLDVSLDSEKVYDNNIYYFILSALLGGRSIYSKIKVNDGEQRQLVDNIFIKSSTSSTVPYFVGIAEFLTNVIPLICRSFSLMMKWYSVESTVTKSVDVEMIRHGFSPPDTDSIDNTNTKIITRNNGRVEEKFHMNSIGENRGNLSNFLNNECFKNQIISGDYSKTPFLVRSAALFTEIMSWYKRKLIRSVNVENATIQTLIHKEVKVFEKKTVILVKSQGFILEFKQRISSWYSYTFSFLNPLPGITNYQQFINKYLEFHTYIIFCKSIASFNDEELDGHVLFMSATPIYGNYQEIPNLVRLIKPGFVCYGPLTPDKLEEIMKGHLSYYGLNPPDTMVNFIGSSIPGIKTFKIFDIPMKKEQLCYYKKLEHDEKKITNIGKIAKPIAFVMVLNIGSGERRHFNNNIFQSLSRVSSFTISYFVGLLEFFTNIIPIVISDFYTMINLHTIKPNVFKSVDVEKISTDLNNHFNPHGVIINEWEELEDILYIGVYTCIVSISKQNKTKIMKPKTKKYYKLKDDNLEDI
ncbi:hypothetical protein H8356DRAFT_1321146 [Neocallimastix lanati (nom. inval.)]|nr:hypothetical protein H8356DRAFT_1321146 [Neocallimastix sp. JGI-2020a]